MGPEEGDAQLDQGRRAEGGKHHVGSRRRKAHAQHDGPQGRQDQRHQQVALGHDDDELGHTESDPGQRCDPDDDPRRGTCRGDLHRTGGPRPEGIRDLAPIGPGAPNRESHGDGRHDAPEGRSHRRPALGEQNHDDDNRQEQVDPPEDVLLTPILGPRQPNLPGPEVDGPQQRCVVEQRRDDRREGDPGIGDVRPRRQDERARPHDRRHELAAGAGRRLDGAGEEGLEAGPAHERDRERAGRDDVGDGTTRQGAHERARHGRSLCRPSLRAARDPIGDSDEQRSTTCDVQEGAEQDEQVDEVGRHAEGDAPDPLGREVQLFDQARDAVSPVREDPRKPRTQ